MVLPGQLEVVPRRPQEGQTPNGDAVLRLVAVVVVRLASYGGVPAVALGAAKLPGAKGDPMGKAAVLKIAAAALRTVVPSVLPEDAAVPLVLAVRDARPTPMSAACSSPRVGVNLTAMLARLVALPLLEEVLLGLEVLPLEPTSSVVLSLRSLATIRTRPPVGLPTLITSGLIQLEGAPGLARAHEVKLRATGFPSPAVARRMASEANGLGSRPAAERPAVAGALPNTVSRAGQVLAATSTAPTARSTAFVATLERAPGVGPAAASTAAPIATTRPTVAGLEIAPTLRRPTAVARAVPSKPRVDTQGPAVDAVHDAGTGPPAVRTAAAASAPISPTRQLTTRPVGRMLRMEGVATTTSTAVVRPRRSTTAREAPGARIPVPRLAAPATGAVRPPQTGTGVRLVAGTTAGRPVAHELRRGTSGPQTPKFGSSSEVVPAASAETTASRLTTVVAGRAAGRASPTSVPSPRGPPAPSLPHAVRPTRLSAVRVALVVGSLLRSVMAVTQPAVALLRPTRPPSSRNARPFGIPTVAPTVRTSPSGPRLPVVLPERTMPKDRQATQ